MPTVAKGLTHCWVVSDLIFSLLFFLYRINASSEKCSLFLAICRKVQGTIWANKSGQKRISFFKNCFSRVKRFLAAGQCFCNTDFFFFFFFIWHVGVKCLLCSVRCLHSTFFPGAALFKRKLFLSNKLADIFHVHTFPTARVTWGVFFLFVLIVFWGFLL